MKLHSPAFEKGLRRRVKVAIRASAALAVEFKQARKNHKEFNSWWIVRPAISAGFGFLVVNVAQSGSPLSAPLAAISLWSFALVTFQALALVRALYQSNDLPALSVLPVPQATIFQWELRKFLWGSSTVLLDLLAAFIALNWHLGSSLVVWALSFVLAILVWAFVLVLAVLGIARASWMPFSALSILFTIAIIVLFVARESIGRAVTPFLVHNGSWLNLALPTGWVVSQFELLQPNPRWSTLFLLVPASALVLATRNCLRQLQDRYDFSETIVPEAPDLVPGVEVSADADGAGGARQRARLGPTAIEEIITSRQFLDPPLWPFQGWFETRLWSWFSSREKALAEFVHPQGLSIWNPWQKIFRNLAIGAATTALFVWLLPALRMVPVVAVLLITACQVAARLFGSGGAFTDMLLGGIKIPRYAVYPIGYRELGRFLIKCSAVHIPFLIPYSVAVGAGVACVAKFPVPEGLALGIKGGWLLFSARFGLLVLGFSSGTNDTSGYRPRNLKVIALAVVGGLAFLGLGAAGIFAPNQTVAAGCCALATVEAYLFFRVYGWFHNRMLFDLMAVPRREELA